MRMLLTIYTLNIILFFSSSYLFAQTMQIEFEFTNYLPKQGVILFHSETTAQSNPPILDQIQKRFTDDFVLVRNNEQLLIKNSDKVSHNIFINDRENNYKYDSGLIKPGEDRKINVSFKDKNAMRVGCKIHPRMKAYLINLKSDFNQFKELNFTKKTIYTLQNMKQPNTALLIIIPGFNELTISLNKNGTNEYEIKRESEVAGIVKVKQI